MTDSTKSLAARLTELADQLAGLAVSAVDEKSLREQARQLSARLADACIQPDRPVMPTARSKPLLRDKPTKTQTNLLAHIGEVLSSGRDPRHAMTFVWAGSGETIHRNVFEVLLINEWISPDGFDGAYTHWKLTDAGQAALAAA